MNKSLIVGQWCGNKSTWFPAKTRVLWFFQSISSFPFHGAFSPASGGYLYNPKSSFQISGQFMILCVTLFFFEKFGPNLANLDLGMFLAISLKKRNSLVGFSLVFPDQQDHVKRPQDLRYKRILRNEALASGKFGREPNKKSRNKIWWVFVREILLKNQKHLPPGW